MPQRRPGPEDMPTNAISEIRYISAQGALGAGVDAAALTEAMGVRPQFIGCDAGTTDAGPYALGAGRPEFGRQSVKRDLALIIAAGLGQGIPVIIGSAGTAGGDAHVDWVVEIAREIATERGEPLRAAVIFTEQSPDYLVRMLEAGRLAALSPVPPVTAETLRRSTRVVAMIGVEPLQEALAAGVDLVIAGRCSDAAIFAAMPIASGFPEGLAWHAGKVVECGQMAMEVPVPGVLAVTLTHDHFDVRAFGDGAKVTPLSIAAHSLYESANPFVFRESSGSCDLTDAIYEEISGTGVRVSGSRFDPAERSTVKLEGAELVGYSTVIIGGIRDPFILRRLDAWLEEVRADVTRRVESVLGDQVGARGYEIAVHRYGHDGVMGDVEPQRQEPPREVGVVWEVLAPTQELATAIAQLSRQPLLHHPIPEWSGGITTFACLHNPAHLERGPVYQFSLHHALAPEDLGDIYRLDIRTLAPLVSVRAG